MSGPRKKAGEMTANKTPSSGRGKAKKGCSTALSKNTNKLAAWFVEKPLFTAWSTVIETYDSLWEGEIGH
jgi:hypothetical protein